MFEGGHHQDCVHGSMLIVATNFSIFVSKGYEG
jgi:hypothetical protein